MNNKKPLGTIFDTITYESSKQLDNMIDDMDELQIKFLITKALESSFNRGAFNLVESEIVSKIIRKTFFTIQEDVNP